MSKPPLKPASARILVTNDDGINAPGLKILEKIARSLSRDVWVVAPEIEQSGAGHSLTLRRPLQVRRISTRRFAVDGTPTDCVLLAVNHLIEGRRPDLVLSGVNRGSNLGEDVTYSGTIAAAMEATLLGIRSVALSQMRQGQEIVWRAATLHGPEVIRRLVSVPWVEGVLVNVNFPYLAKGRAKGVQVVQQGRRAGNIEVAHATDPMGRKYLWIGDFTNDNPVGEGTDLWAVRQGAIAVTPLHLDLTHAAMSRRLADAFG
jgi:5'/3'-nucleotidase